MKYFLIITSLLLLASCTETPIGAPVGKNTIPLSQSQSQALYVDVREPSEWQAGHISGAILVPLADIEAGRLDKIPKDTPVNLYCRSGRRSGIAHDILKKAGYTNITNVGGIDQVPGVQIVR